MTDSSNLVDSPVTPGSTFGQIKETEQGFEVKYPANENAAYALALLTHQMITTPNFLVKEDKSDLTNFVVWNEILGTYAYVGIDNAISGGYGTDIIHRNVKINLGDGRRMRIALGYNRNEENGPMIPPLFLVVNDQSLKVMHANGVQEQTSKNIETVDHQINILEMGGQILNSIGETIVDPFKIIYGKYTPVELAKEVLGTNAVVDENARTIIQVLGTEKLATGQTRTCMIFDLDGQIEIAETILRERISNMEYADLFALLNAATE
jgi:hypothetical protein